MAMHALFGPCHDYHFPFCPAPPDWSLDWSAIVERFGWLQPLGAVPQDPQHHPEGDVLTHTRMVVEELVGLDAWRALPPVERSVLFAAALLHDLGKTTHTRVEPDGRITARGHALASADRARVLLWRGEGLDAPPFACRAAIEALVRLHGLPLWSWSDDEHHRRILRASYSVRLELLALLAEADVRGRMSADKDELLERIDLFRLLCQDLGCYDRPRPFATDHARFVFFQRGGTDPDYVPYERDPFEVVLMAGLPGAGKDTWINRHAPTLPVVSLDQVRSELGIAPTGEQGAVVRAAKQRAKEQLRRRQPFAWNATNITRRLRAPLVDLFVEYGAHVHLVYVDAPYPAIVRRNREREAGVPQRAVERLMDKLELPDATEAHHVTWVSQAETI